jgi:hypothetical protein
MSKEKHKDKEALIKHFGDLLNAFEPDVQVQQNKSALTVTLHFETKQAAKGGDTAFRATDDMPFRRLARMVADYVA